jgi:hypothetical protein
MSERESALYRLQLALADLERATVERNLPVARYLLATEITEALHAVALHSHCGQDFVDGLRQAVAAVRVELWRDPR